MFWFDTGYEPFALFTALMSGEKVTRISLDSDTNSTYNAHSLCIDPLRGILFWSQPHRAAIRALETRKGIYLVCSSLGRLA